MKPREMWYDSETESVYFSPPPYEIEGRVTRYREVVPIDWEKIFEELNVWSSRFILEQYSWQDKFKQLVEKQLAGEK